MSKNNIKQFLLYVNTNKAIFAIKIISMTTQQKVGKRLKEARKKANLTQTEVGRVIGQVYQSYAKYERGQIQLDYDKMITLCKFLNISSDYLLGLETKENDINFTEEFEYSDNIHKIKHKKK